MLNAVSIIAAKRDGQPIAAEAIDWLITAYARGEVPDYQMSAFAMAVYWRGMSVEETAALTAAMLNSGERFVWSDTARPIVDKHSTGGIGDKVSLILAPLLACCDVWVPMISGRGLGPTGGTLDKLESISGFRTDLSIREIQDLTGRVGCVITGATDEIAPADRKLYGLRDVTGTVASIPLITASIMSKKLAETLDALVLDVKWGAGAFMKTLPQAEALAASLVETGRQMGVETRALLTDMNQPLGKAIGNSIEVRESLAALRGEGPDDLMRVTYALGGELLHAAGRVATPAEGRQLLKQHVAEGQGAEKFAEMVHAQGGDVAAVRPLAKTSEWCADRVGYVHSVDNERLGSAVIQLGGGRRVLGDPIDHSVGFEMLVRIGDRVESGAPLLRIYAHGSQHESIRAFLEGAITIGDSPAEPPLLIRGVP